MEDMNKYTTGSYRKETGEIRSMSLFQRVVGIIVSPAETMKSLINKPRIVLPIIMIAFGLIALYIIRLPLYKETLRSGIELALQNANIQMTPAQIDDKVNTGAILNLAGTPFGALIGWIIWASLIFALIKIFKGEGRYKQYLSVTGYSYVIIILYYVLSLIISLATNTLAIDLRITSAANLLPAGTKDTLPFLYGILSGVEVFAIWRLVVTGIGLKLLSKLSSIKVYSILFALYALELLITGVGVAVASMFK